jgi:argininosuccinate lyase
MRARAAEGWVTITELADTLARDHGVPFAAAHGVASRVIRGVREQPDAQLSDLVSRAARDLSGREIRMSGADLERVLAETPLRSPPPTAAPDVSAARSAAERLWPTTPTWRD